ncbi:ABC transporter permease [Bosea sp. PAMC 26642]|uniref:ABC transporter permease n=1 Tax=Bosea sp. (strain PAMC 26642) TaxID=1792307 RepID=UPI0009E8CBE0|nr:ABC transporter permease [Bosea sp. PAMC 26642]
MSEIVTVPTASVPPRGPGLLARLMASPVATLAALVLLLIVLASLFAPWLARSNPYDLAALDLLDSQLPPAFMPGGDSRFLLGTDSQGADLASLILYGVRISLLVGLLAVTISASVGTLAGLVSGYFGGWVDSIVMRIADIQFTFPAMLLALLIGGVSQSLLPGDRRAALALPIVVLALGISHWPHFARLVRGAVLTERQKDYVAACRLGGRGHVSIMLRQILPNVLNSVFVLATLDIAFAIMAEATLSFLSFGLPPTQPSLGTLIRTGYGFLFSGEWHLVIFPALTLVLLLVSINIVGDRLRDSLDPKLR